MRIIGIDPGTSATGYGVIDEFPGGRLSYVASGVIATPTRSTIARRLKLIYDEVTEVINRERPSAVVVEDTFMSKNAQAALKLGQARGVVLLAAEKLDLPTYEYTATQVKSAVVGYGGARKEQVQEMVVRLLHAPEGMSRNLLSHHASDALACAICHIHSMKLATLGEF